MEDELDNFCADAFEAVSDLGFWPSFVREMENYGYDDVAVERLFADLNKRAGRA